MQMYLQFGYGMMDHCRVLIQSWGEGTVILSPRDLAPEQISRFSKDITKINGETLVDPQLYNPRSDHHRLTKHSYWPDEYSTNLLFDGSSLDQMLCAIRLLNDSALTSKYIIPGFYCSRVDDDWIRSQEAFIQAANPIFWDKPALATICLSGDVLRFEEQIEEILNSSESWDVEGYYIVPEHPSGAYLVDDPMWLTNLLMLCSGLKLQGREVIVGYCSHQMLCLGLANVDAIASGSWLNVRSFPPSKFRQLDEDSTSRRALWYYCPQALSEYKLQFLDMAFRAQALDLLRPDSIVVSSYAGVLFSGAQPSSTGYSETDSFRHYLHCLHDQAAKVRCSTFSNTVVAYTESLEKARETIALLRKSQVLGGDRDFKDIVDTNLASVMALQEARGFILEHQW